jgi:hypothetical protein
MQLFKILRVASLGHITLIPSQPVFTLTTCIQATNTNFKVFGFTRGVQPTATPPIRYVLMWRQRKISFSSGFFTIYCQKCHISGMGLRMNVFIVTSKKIGTRDIIRRIGLHLYLTTKVDRWQFLSILLRKKKHRGIPHICTKKMSTQCNPLCLYRERLNTTIERLFRIECLLHLRKSVILLY